MKQTKNLQGFITDYVTQPNNVKCSKKQEIILF